MVSKFTEVVPIFLNLEPVNYIDAGNVQTYAVDPNDPVETDMVGQLE